MSKASPQTFSEAITRVISLPGIQKVRLISAFDVVHVELPDGLDESSRLAVAATAHAVARDQCSENWNSGLGVDLEIAVLDHSATVYGMDYNGNENIAAEVLLSPASFEDDAIDEAVGVSIRHDSFSKALAKEGRIGNVFDVLIDIVGGARASFCLQDEETTRTLANPNANGLSILEEELDREAIKAGIGCVLRAMIAIEDPDFGEAFSQIAPADRQCIELVVDRGEVEAFLRSQNGTVVEIIPRSADAFCELPLSPDLGGPERTPDEPAM